MSASTDVPLLTQKQFNLLYKQLQTAGVKVNVCLPFALDFLTKSSSSPQQHVAKTDSGFSEQHLLVVPPKKDSP